jgi:hypothetical protein
MYVNVLAVTMYLLIALLFGHVGTCAYYFCMGFSASFNVRFIS